MHSQRNRLSFSLDEITDEPEEDGISISVENGSSAEAPPPSIEAKHNKDARREKRRKLRSGVKEECLTDSESRDSEGASPSSRSVYPSRGNGSAQRNADSAKRRKLKFSSMAEMTAAKFACENKAAAQRLREERLYSALHFSPSCVTSSVSPSFTSVARGSASFPLKGDTAPGDISAWRGSQGFRDCQLEGSLEERLEPLGFFVGRESESRRDAPFDIAFSVCGLKGQREKNEDRYSAVVDFAHNAALFAVFDGHNGADSASFCSAFLAPLLARQLSEKCPPRVSASCPLAPQRRSGVPSLRCDFSDPRKCRAALRYGDSAGEDPSWIGEGAKAGEEKCECNNKRDGNGCLSVRAALTEVFIELNSLYLRKNPSAEDGTTALALLLRWPSKTASSSPRKRRRRREEESASDTTNSESDLREKQRHSAKKQDCCQRGGDFSSSSSASDGGTISSSDSSDGEGGQDDYRKKHAELFAAHVGDSRAVLLHSKMPPRTKGGEDRVSRQLKAVRLTEDHKPSRETERRRIIQCGGFVVLLGCHRVGFGKTGFFLAMSRSIGDYSLKRAHEQLVPADPEITHRQLRPFRDVLVLLASDGLWDVMSDQQAAEFVASQCLQRDTCGSESRQDKKQDEQRRPPRFSQATLDAAAKSLAEEALRRGSEDNVTVLLVGLNWKSRRRKSSQ